METSVDSLSVSLARWIEAVRYEDLPSAVIHHVRRSLLDYFGVTIRGSTSRIPRILQGHLSATEGTGPASVIGTALTLSAANAAFANGCAAAALELDDGHARTAIHLGATCLPAILATAQVRRAFGRDVVVAAAAAQEAAARLALAADRASARGFSFTPLVGVFGAAIGVGKVLGSEANAITHALGMAGSNTGGLFEYYGGWLDTWPLNVGRAGRDGLLCATLAEAGLAGPVDIFDESRGFAAAFTDGYLDANDVLNALGHDWLMLETYVKPYPCCRRLHSPIDAALGLRERIGPDIDGVERIIVETSAESARLDGKTFDSVAAAQMSIPYGVAVALVFGAPGLEHFEEATRRNPRVLRLVEKIELRASNDSIITEHRSAARVSVRTVGNTTSVLVTDPSGNPANPVNDVALSDRFRYLAEPVLGREATMRLNEALWFLGEAPESLRDGDGLHLIQELACAGASNSSERPSKPPDMDQNGGRTTE